MAAECAARDEQNAFDARLIALLYSAGVFDDAGVYIYNDTLFL